MPNERRADVRPPDAGADSKSRFEEGRLRDAVAFLQNILDSSSSISIISTDREGNILYWNSGAENLFGYKAEEVVGCRKTDILYLDGEEDTAELIESARAILSGEKTTARCEVREATKDGRTLWINMTLTPRVDDRGQVTGILGVGEDVTDRRRAEEEMHRSLRKVRQSLDGVIQAMVRAVEIRDPYTAGHQRTVADLAGAIAREMGFSEERIEGLRMAGIVHDLGKISVPSEILSKPGRLTEIQFDMIKTHPQVGYEIMRNIDFPWPVAEIMLQHHERMDGSGYPSGLAGEDILPEARILAVADVVEAMASHRPYRPSLGIDRALAEVSDNRGRLYDPDVVDACLKLFREKGYSLGSSPHEIEEVPIR
jgi:PAS domain S-box-containing protein/putative nucleotidyltransferase with HDIG domain